jgi:DNA modification methylase
MPMPAEWVTVRRIRVKDAVEYVWWLGTPPWPKANNRTVLQPYSQDMERLHTRGITRTTRPSGHHIQPSFSEVSPGDSIPPNIVEDEWPCKMLKWGNNAAHDPYTARCKAAGIKIHPARFPAALPECFIKLLTEAGDIVLDPFAGSNTTGAVAEKRHRRWIAIENVETSLEASKFRFE